MKTIGTINILAFLLLGLLLPLAGCERDEPDEFTIVGSWRSCRGDGWWPPEYTFPPNGILSYEEYNERSRTLKYQLTENKDTLRIIEIFHYISDKKDEEAYSFRIYDRKIHFYNNDSIRIDAGDYDYDWFLGPLTEYVTFVRIKK